MHIAYNAFKKAFFSLCLTLPFYIAACGDDSGNSSTAIFEDEEEDNLGGETFKDTTITSNQFNSNAGVVNIIKSEILDVKSGNSYKTIQFGPYTWMAENANYKISRSACYDGDTDYCKTYGRLYQSMNADQACPSGFKIPSEADFKYITRFTNSITDPAFGFNPQMSGYCETVNGELQCSRLGKEAYYITTDFNVFRVNSKSKFDFPEANYSAYYALRCMKTSHFVENDKQLPICDSTTYNSLSNFYVASKGYNYRCNRKKWVEAEDNSCPSAERGEKHYYKDTLFVCRGSWQYATMSDVDVSCTKKNQWEILKLNGQSYICDDSTWRKPSTIETAIGLCTLDSLKKMSAAIDKDNEDTTDYICDSTGWRRAVLTDSIGFCTKKNQWEQKKNYEQDYICKDSTWRKPTTIEAAIGLCTPDSIKKMDAVKTKSDTTEYFCDSTGWRRAVLTDSIGKCTLSREWEEKKNYGKNYICRDSVWKRATTREDSIGFCTPKRIGKIDSLKSGSSYSSYYCDSTGWRNTVMVDFVGKCESSKFYTTVEYRSTTYVCRPTKKWDILSSTEKSIGICSPKINGKIDTLKSSGTSYICDSTSWRTTNIYDYYGDCDSTKLYTTKTFNDETYGCTNPTKWEKLTHPTSEFGFCKPKLKGTIKTDKSGKDFICDSIWRSATKAEVLGTCDSTKQTLQKPYNSVTYACVNNEWRTLTSLETALGLCTKENLNIIKSKDNVSYICNDTGWAKYTVEQVFGECFYKNEYKTAEFGGYEYVCKHNKWTLIDSIEYALGFCKETSYYKVYEYKGDYYYCSDDEEWEIAPARYALQALDKCTSEKLGKTAIYRGVEYYCSDGDIWYEYTTLDKELGVCHSGIIDKVVEYNGKNYGCAFINGNGQRKYFWREEEEADRALGFCHGLVSKIIWKEYNGKDYVCDDKQGKWKNSSSMFAMYGSCTSSDTKKIGVTVGLNGQHYYCNTNMNTTSNDLTGWYALQPIDSIKGPCYYDKLGDTLTFESAHYYCGKNINGYYRWLPATTFFQYYGKCGMANEGKVAEFNGMNLQCYENNWRRDPGDYRSITDSRDGNRYKTIKIGKQEWFAENLKYEIDGSWCGGNINGCNTYGRLYSWDMTIGQPKDAHPTLANIEDPEDLQGVCPKGWRVPSTLDWSILLKECNSADLSKTLTGYDSLHTDLCGFSAFPTGYENVFFRNGIDYTEELVTSSTPPAYWSSEQVTDTTATSVVIPSNSNTISATTRKKVYGYPVRCIKK